MSGWQAWLGPAVVAALISAMVTTVGWFVPYWRERRKDESRRTQRAADMRRALSAEIASHLVRYDESDFDRHFDSMRRAMDADPSFAPFVPKESLNASVYHAMLADLTLLPEGAINPVVSYYAQLTAVERFSDDLRSPEYVRLAPDRRRLMYEHFFSMKILSARLARAALVELTPQGLSSPAMAPDDQARAARTSSSRT